MHHSKTTQGSFALKLDMSKAYYRVDWSFLSQALLNFGITDRAHALIMSCHYYFVFYPT